MRHCLHFIYTQCGAGNTHICIGGGGWAAQWAALCVGKIYARIAPNAAVDIDHPKIGKYLTALQFAFAILLPGERVLQKDQEEQTTGYRLSRCL